MTNNKRFGFIESPQLRAQMIETSDDVVGKYIGTMENGVRIYISISSKHAMLIKQRHPNGSTEITYYLRNGYREGEKVNGTGAKRGRPNGSRKEGTKVIYQGETYASRRACAMKYGVPCSTINSYIRKKNLTFVAAMDLAIKVKQRKEAEQKLAKEA